MIKCKQALCTTAHWTSLFNIRPFIAHTAAGVIWYGTELWPPTRARDVTLTSHGTSVILHCSYAFLWSTESEKSCFQTVISTASLLVIITESVGSTTLWYIQTSNIISAGLLLQHSVFAVVYCSNKKSSHYFHSSFARSCIRNSQVSARHNSLMRISRSRLLRWHA